MTEDDGGQGEGAPSVEPQRPTLTGRQRQAIEILLWLVSPALLLLAAIIVAAVLGAPLLRASLVFAICAVCIGSYLLFRPQAWIPIGLPRSAGLIYTGLGTFLIALGLFIPHEQQSSASQIAWTISPRTSASTPTRDVRPFYPWPFSVPSVTLTCRDASGPGVGTATATTADGREFALNEAAAGRYPAIDPIRLLDADHANAHLPIADVVRAALSLCLGRETTASPLLAIGGEAPRPPPPPPPSPPPPPPSAWDYHTTSDEMSDGAIHQACTTSTNTVSLGWPYEVQTVVLCLRQHPRWGQDVIIRLSRGGQFLCTSYEACAIRVRFDDGEAAAYSAREPSDNSSDTIFITNDARFISNARRSSRVIIEANFYQAGAQRMTFNTERLEWPSRR